MSVQTIQFWYHFEAKAALSDIKQYFTLGLKDPFPKYYHIYLSMTCTCTLLF